MRSFKMMFCYALVLLATLFAVTGCGDTWEGFGRDVQDVGEAIED